MKAATYVRVSTEEQAENGTSLKTQRERTRAYVEEKGYTLVHEFVEQGVSGAKESRPQLDRLKRACDSGEVEVIVVTRHDRFARSLLNALLLMRDLDALGVVVEFTDEPNETGLIRNLRFAIAEDERERIRERTRAGKRAVKAQGFWIGGRVPFGFMPVPEGAHKRLVVEENEAETIRLAATLLVDERCSTHEVAERLNGLGRLPRKAARWDHMLLRHMLRRRIVVPDILTEERFDQVQASLEATALTPKRERDHVYPLSLRLFGTCGAPYRGVYRADLATPRRYYTCKNKDWEQRATRCEDKSLHAEDIEYVVWEQVCEILSTPERLLSLAEEYLGLRGQQIEFERDWVADLDAQIAKQEKVLADNVTEAVKAGLPASVIQDVTAQLTSELDALRRHRGMLDSWREESARESQRMRRLWELADGAHKRLPLMRDEEQKEMLDLLDVRVTVLEHETKETPARVRIEGVVGTLALTSAAREIGAVETRRS
jgi:DNA invertase Pin-like site-specific DNA recombinase